MDLMHSIHGLNPFNPMADCNGDLFPPQSTLRLLFVTTDLVYPSIYSKSGTMLQKDPAFRIAALPAIKAQMHHRAMLGVFFVRCKPAICSIIVNAYAWFDKCG
jgi:hypothetical protein